MANNYEPQKVDPWKHDETLPNKSCEYVIPNRKSLKKWLKFENFHFIHRNFSFFLLLGLKINNKLEMCFLHGHPHFLGCLRISETYNMPIFA